jgi:hypothetical protein
MIKFQVHGTQIKVEINPGINGSAMLLYWETNSSMLVHLLRDKLHDELNKKLTEMRREAYESGWRDAKAKSAKKTWFSGWWKN